MTPERTPKHGTEGEYRRGCRCVKCKRANTDATSARRARANRIAAVRVLETRAAAVKSQASNTGLACTIDAQQWANYLELRRAAEDAEMALLDAELRIQAKMGAATLLKVGRRVVATWAPQTRAAYEAPET